MEEITYQSIRPLVERAAEDGPTLYCVFRCSLSGTAIKSRASLHHGVGRDEPTAGGLGGMTVRIRRAVVQSLQELLGYGPHGRLDQSEPQHAPPAPSGAAFTEADRQAAVVQAFRNVASRFMWDGVGRRWVAARPDTRGDYLRQLDAAPVQSEHERSILARMLLDVARADGHIADDEKDFLSQVIGPDLERLQAAGPITRTELEAASPGTRETILMLSWALALTDLELAEGEREQLSRHAEALGIAPERAAQLKRFAQDFILEHNLYDRPAPLPRSDDSTLTDVHRLADAIGLSREEADEVVASFRKRRGSL